MLSSIQNCQMDRDNQKAPQHHVVLPVLPSHNSLNSLFLWPHKEIQRINLISYSVTTAPTTPECTQVCWGHCSWNIWVSFFMILNTCINALLNWSQLKQKSPCPGEKRDMHQLNTKSSHPKQEPHLRILQALLVQYCKHLSFWGFDLKFRNFQKQPIKWTCFIKVSNLGQKWRYSNLLASLRNPGFCISLKQTQQLPLPFLTPLKAAVWSWLICLGMLHTVIFRRGKTSQEFQFHKGL